VLMQSRPDSSSIFRVIVAAGGTALLINDCQRKRRQVFAFLRTAVRICMTVRRHRGLALLERQGNRIDEPIS
jgi:hypothetical protein